MTSTRNPLTTHRGALALSAVAVLGLAACTSATGSAAEADAADAAGAGASTAAVDNACAQQAQADVDASRAPLDLVAPSETVDLSSVQGETVWFITVTMNQFSTDMAAGVEAAAEAAGLEAVMFDGQGSANTFNEGITRAVAQDAGGIVLVGIDPALVQGSLAQAEAAGIPVLNTLNSDPTDPVPDGMFANFTSDFTADGATVAEWALADSGCDMDIALVYSSTIAVWDKLRVGAVDTIESMCPDDCTITELDVDLANLATDMPSQLQTALQRNPDIDYVFVVWDSGVPYAVPVVASSGTNAKILARDGIAASLESIAGDQGQELTVATPPPSWIGWAATDAVLREMVGAPSADLDLPTRLIDATNVGDGSDADVSPAFVDYAPAFEATWSK